jgi:hypothetical protein
MLRVARFMNTLVCGWKSGGAVNPAASHLFNTNITNPEYLTTNESKLFVHMVVQLLFLSQRARPDLRIADSFLCTRIADSFLCTRLQKPDKDG